MKHYGTMLTCFAALVLLPADLPWAQPAYPNKPIRLIVPFPPGGAFSPLARLLGQKITESWGQSVVIDNRPGASTMIGTESLVRSPPDGHTLMLAGGNLVLVPMLFKASYDPMKDLVPVATFARTELVLVIHPAVPATTLKEFIAYAKSMPGKLNYATPGAGGSQHLAHELLNLAADIKTAHIPYKGGGPALTDLLGGQVEMFFSTVLIAMPHIQGGKVRGLAVTGRNRSQMLPGVPTFNEAGLPGLDEIGSWYGIISPASTPKAIVDKLANEIANYMAMPDFKERILEQGLELFPADPAQFAALLKADLARFTRIIKAANIKLEN